MTYVSTLLQHSLDSLSHWTALVTPISPNYLMEQISQAKCICSLFPQCNSHFNPAQLYLFRCVCNGSTHAQFAMLPAVKTINFIVHNYKENKYSTHA